MSKPSTFHPSGKGHWALELLERGPMRRLDLIAEADFARIKKILYVIAALQSDGLILHRGTSYEITTLGRAALETLRGGGAYCRADGERRAA